MFYRRAGIRHFRYQSERQLWPLTFDRRLIQIVIVLLILAPFVLDRLYVVSYLLPWVIWSTAALGLNLLMGGAGQIHLGYGAIMGIGAYTGVHLMRAGLTMEVAMILGGLAAAVIGSVFGAAALRVKGIYLAMATLAMQYIVDFTITHFQVISGGAQATLQVPASRFLGIPIRSDAGFYFVALLVCALVTSFLLNMRRTSLGRALAAIREKDYAAAVIGVSSFRYKMLAFWVSSFIGGVMGVVLASCYYKAVAPDQFHLNLSIQLLAIVIVGGLGSVLGTFFGTALILFAPIAMNALISDLAGAFGLALSRDLESHLPLVLYGAMISGFLLWEPLGLAKLYYNLRNYLLVWPFRNAR
ncbi:MAG: branched-chain amino acid ABC transporter permease [Salipiger thiooxidans]